ncbi:helix-turn-helix domain-containing protein [Micromonospora sp. WMMA1923]|uniref:helix-turn-helix domain-containing protein n=1 Tax=Micromonospora sp. WMMA1923 TaxID=3404125 RepID=UPI003B92AE40
MSIDVVTNEDVPQFGLLIRQHRTRIGLTQRELADFSTVSVRAIRDLEQGRARRPRQDTVRLIADGLRLGLRARADLETAANQGRTSWAVKASYEADPPAAPVVADCLFGREQESAVVTGELAGGAERLVTVVGMTGVGRTRLALEVAARLHGADHTPVLWCALTEQPGGPAGGDRMAALVRGCVEQLFEPATDAPGAAAAGEDLAAFVETVAERPPLLVIDGVGDRAARPERFAQLLRHCPGLRVLVTAEHPLEVPGERPFLLTPLMLPEETDPADPSAIGRSAAVRLFVDRARRVRPDFTLTAADAPLVAEICRRVDGLPLALQAAASWLVVYDITMLHQCLHGDPAGLLQHVAGAEGGNRLRDTLHRRLARLPVADRELLATLCARGDSFGLPDVMALTGRGVADSGRVVRDLVLHGLVRPSYDHGQSRFRILHLVRAVHLGATPA